MASKGFQFKSFEVFHDRCAMKVGTDGVLLGAWARGGKHMLDIGSGTGLVSLFLAQRYPYGHVEGVEIDGEAVRQSCENIAASPFSQRITIYKTAFQHFVPRKPYDAIVSNPPYFLNSLDTPDSARTLARHAGIDFFKSFFSFAKQWLLPDGEVSLVIPMDSYEHISTEAYLLGFLLSRKVSVRSVSSKPIERCLVSFVRRRILPVETREECMLKENGARSDWYHDLTQEFYLK